MTTKLLLLATAASLLASHAYATEAAVADTADIGATGVSEVVISANRSAQRADRIGETVTVLNDATIKASQATSLVELLVQTPGVSFSRNGGPGQTTSLRIRGAETGQTVVVIDGVKLNDPSSTDSGYNSANLLTGDTARIEVLRGAQSVLWGSQAIGGVVNIITVEPTKPVEGSMSAEIGEMGTTYFRAAVGGASERMTWRLAGSRFDTDGVSSYRFGTEKDGYKNNGVSGRLNYKVTDTVSLDLRTVYSDGRNNFDGFLTDDLEYGKTRDWVSYAGVNVALFDGRLKNRIGYAYTQTDRDNFNPVQQVTTKTFDAEGKNKRIEYQGVFDIREGWTATFGAENEDSSFRTASPSASVPNPVPASAKTSILGLYAQVQGEVLTGLTLTGGVRRDDHDTAGVHTAGQAAAAWSLNDGATVLRASWGQGFKAPSLYQLYSQYGNTALKPEAANESWDAGVEQAFGEHLRASATYFSRRIENQIDFVSCASTSTDPLCKPGGVFRFGYYDNIAKTKAQGVEVAGSATFGPVSLQGNYTWSESLNDAVGTANFGKFLARRPEYQGNVWATYVWPFKLATTVAVRYSGLAYDNVANTTPLGSYTLYDLRASYPVTEAIEVYGRIENLTNRAYETTKNYGSPGRAAYVGVRASF